MPRGHRHRPGIDAVCSPPPGLGDAKAYSGRASSVVQDSSAGADGGKRLLSRQEMDALGNLKSVRNDDWAGGNSWTQVAEVLLLHDVEGQLLVVTPSLGITLTTVITYDLAGRKTDMRDPDLGVWGYTYSKHGALLTQSDARNCLTTLAYDLKGRVVSKVGSGCTAATGTDTTGYTVNFGYFAMGSALGSSGQLASAGYSDNRFRRSLTYDGDGLLTGQTVTVTGLSPVTLAFGYDGYDRPTTTSYPALGGQPAEVVTTAYADTGQPMTLTSSLSGVIGVLRYDAYRRPVTLTYSAGGVAQVWGYYAFNSNGTAAGHGNTEGRLASLKVGTGALNQPHFTYSYDRFGNLETITDAGAPNTFVYDLQNRLTNAYGESYSYDGIGRLTNYEGTALIAFGAYGRRTTSAVYTDDAVGNLTGRLSETGVAQTLKWNHENRLVEVKSSNLLTETYGYDEAGQRVKRTTVAKMGANNLTTTTYYIGAGQEVQNGVPVRYYSLGGNTLGVRQGASVSWLYGDHLGSTSASSGAAATSERYYAYGKDRGTGNLPTDHRFTGQISDASGLVFMNARYYDPVLGSFLSPDTLVPEPGQPEGYNRYAYANGNPLLFCDPSGHASCAAGDNACWQQEWQWNNRWYEAHGYFWNGGTSHWSNTGWARFADRGILDETVGEAGIGFRIASAVPTLPWSEAEQNLVGQGIVALGQKVGGMQHLLSLLVHVG